jgi:membrane protein required for beta-lactamase induction
MIGFYFEQISWGKIQFYYHPLFGASLLLLIGYQLIIFAVFAKTYAHVHLNEPSFFLERIYRYLTIEKVSLVGLSVTFLGSIILVLIGWRWYSSNFGPLAEIKNLIIAQTMIFIGVQTIFSSFMLSILGIKNN